MIALLAALLLAAPARADVQCMARLGVSWVSVTPPTGAVDCGTCETQFRYGTEPYTLQGTTMMDGRVTCQWKWAGKATMVPPSGVPESFTCNLFP